MKILRLMILMGLKIIKSHNSKESALFYEMANCVGEHLNKMLEKDSCS